MWYSSEFIIQSKVADDIESKILNTLDNDKEPSAKLLANYLNSNGLFFLEYETRKRYMKTDKGFKEITIADVSAFFNKHFGYNEISDAADKKLKEEIEDILGIKNVTVIVTSRNPIFPFTEGTMSEIKLCDLEREQIKAFLGGNEDDLPTRNYEGMLTNPFMLEVCIETFSGKKGCYKNINEISLAEIFEKYIDKQITNFKLSSIDQIYIKVILPLVAMKLDERIPPRKTGIVEKIQKDSALLSRF